MPLNDWNSTEKSLEWMMFLLTCDKKLTKSQLSPTHASTKRKITDELKHNAGWYEVREGSPKFSGGIISYDLLITQFHNVLPI